MSESYSSSSRWRREFGLGGGAEGALESVADPGNPASQSPVDRIAQAREAMIRLVKDRFGGDAALIAQVTSMTLSASDALIILQEAQTAALPTPTQFEALEAVVVFDGTRPSFLLKDDEINFDSSFNTGPWKQDLKPFLPRLAEHAACVGRVERDGRHQGTAFLVTPTLAITNRHVAQLIATFADGKATMLADCTLDFGREDGAGRTSFDARKVREIAFAGAATVAAPIDHERLDLAVLRLSESTLSGDAGKRHMVVGGVAAGDFMEDSRFITAIGYPTDPELVTPFQVWTEYGQMIRKLLEGDGGAKRLAPGQPMKEPRTGLTEWTATHDATTINGNSGSPLIAFPVAGDKPRAAGLHYGGRSGGDRVNWAHLLHYAAAKPGYGTEDTFAVFCKREGIDLTHI